MKWITAQNLQDWANTNAARTVFPALIADLITATAQNISEFRFPNREKGQIRGFDGVLDATGAPPFVPDGHSIWEFGTSGDVLEKADNDFEKRTRDVEPEVRAETTFVFATPRTWDRINRQIPDWLNEKRALNLWKDVLCLDGVQLEHWLDSHPAVASRYARYELCLVPSTDAYSSDEFWVEYSTRFNPTLSEDVLLAGREAQVASLFRRLAEGGSRLEFAADSADEVIAFVVAAIRSATPENRAFWESRVLVVDDSNAARQLAAMKGLIYLPRGQAREVVGLMAQAGPTLISASADEKRGQHELLVRPTNSQLAKAFVTMGVDESEGYEWARRCGRSLAVLARQRPSGTAKPPEWLGESGPLIPALLAGAWKPAVEADKETLKRLGGLASYEGIEAPLRRLMKLKDPPIDRVSDVWSMRSSVDAFVYLGAFIGSEHLERFAEQAKAVFSRVVETPKAQDVFRPASLQRDQHSSWLREGMMTTLLHMAALHDQAEFVVTGSTPQHFVDEIIRGLPSLSADHRLLESLRAQLPLLAEAAPRPFFEALEQLLEGNGEAIKPIFNEQTDFFAPASAHTDLLWALEVLAWDENYLLRASICLAKLAAIDPGGKLSNRPINSLREVFLSWSPNTNAPSKARMGVLSSVIQVVPSIAWSLLVKLLPQLHDSGSPTQRPKFAEASPGGQEVLTYSIVWETQAFIVELAVQHAGQSSERWLVLINHLSQLQPTSFEQVVDALELCLDHQVGEERFATWDALRKEVNRQRAFNNADWALNSDALSRLNVLVAKFQPEDSLLVTTWLFDDWMPGVEGVCDGDDPMEAIQAARTEALKGVFSTHGVHGLVTLAGKVKLPLQMVEPLSQLALIEQDRELLLKQLLMLGGEAKSLAPIVVAQGLADLGEGWLERIRRLQAELQLSAQETAWLFLALDDRKSTWDHIASFGTEVDGAYWQQKGAFNFKGTSEEMEYAIARYRSNGRVVAAIEAIHRRLTDVQSSLILSLLGAAVPEINAMVGQSRSMLEYFVERLFEELGTRTDVTQEDLARIEFVYLPLFHRRKSPLTLHKMLVESPEFFVSIISTIFKPDNGEAPNLSEQERRLAAAAYELLNGLEILPGQVDNEISFSSLQAWAVDVRERAAQVDRQRITESRIGHLLAHAPIDPTDHAWPHRAVRQLIDQFSCDAIEKAVRIERFNMRGVYGKAIGEGGQQERELSEQAKQWASVMPAFPRTANLLSSIADMWFRAGEEADADAAQDALRR